MEVVETVQFGRVLVARKPYTIGEVVHEDVPLLSWNSRDVPDDIAALCTLHSVSPILCSVLPHFVKLTKSQQDIISNMHAPTMQLDESVCNLFQVILKLREKVPFSEYTVDDLVHVIVAAKTNAHTGSNATQWVLFPVASKFAHSCDPNTLYDADTGRFTAISNIAYGDVLSFSYIGGPDLTKSSLQRQLRLKRSHYFVCQCKRCCGIDHGRGFRCREAACNGTLFRLGTPLLCFDVESSSFAARQGHIPHDHIRSRLWECDVCGDGKCDSELTSDMLLEAQVEEALNSDKWKLDKRTPTLESLGELRQMLQTVMANIGRNHWVYSRLCWLLSSMFKDFSGAGDIARQMALAWGRFFLRSLKQMRLDLDSSSEVPRDTVQLTDRTTTAAGSSSTAASIVCPTASSLHTTDVAAVEPSSNSSNIDASTTCTSTTDVSTPTVPTREAKRGRMRCHVVSASFRLSMATMCGTSSPPPMLKSIVAPAYPLFRSIYGIGDKSVQTIRSIATAQSSEQQSSWAAAVDRADEMQLFELWNKALDLIRAAASRNSG